MIQDSRFMRKGEWRRFKGGYVYYFDNESTSNRKYWSTARVDENGVFILNYFTRTKLPVDCSSTYRYLKPNLRELFYGYDSDKRLLIIEPLSMSRHLYITNVQYYCNVNREDFITNEHLMTYLESLIKESVVFYSSIEEYLDLQRLKHNADMRLRNQREDDYCK